MKEIKDIFPNEWKEAIELVEQKHIQACENRENGERYDGNYLNIKMMANVIMKNLAITLQNSYVQNQEGGKVPVVTSIDLVYNSDDELNDHIIMMYYDKEYDEYKIASQGIYECIEGSYLELLNEFR